MIDVNPGMIIGAMVASPTAVNSTAAATDGNIVATLMQLGIGGAFVVFGAAIYRRFEQRADTKDEAHRAEVAALRAEHAAEVAAVRREYQDRINELSDRLLNQRKDM